MASKRSLDALKAAYYWVYDPALTQDQIASRAGLGTQVQVSRLLKEAREQKVLREVFRFPADLTPEDRLEIVNSFFERHGQLRTRCPSTLGSSAVSSPAAARRSSNCTW